MAAGNAAASGTVLSIGLKPANAAIHKTAKPRHLDAEYRGPKSTGDAHAAMQTQFAGKSAAGCRGDKQRQFWPRTGCKSESPHEPGFSSVQVSDRPLATRLTPCFSSQVNLRLWHAMCYVEPV